MYVANGRPSWWRLPLRDLGRMPGYWIVFGEPVWWYRAGWCVLGPCYRLLMALGLWDVAEGGFYEDGRLVWENRLVKSHPTFPVDGRAFWAFVFRGYT